MSKKKITKEQRVYLTDLMYLPIQYHRIQAKPPVFKGKGNHSINDLEKLCKEYEEYCHQQAIIKQNVMKHLVEIKFDVEVE